MCVYTGYKEGDIMLQIDIPGRNRLELQYLVVDYNGTIARDGILIPGVEERFLELSSFLQILVLTADTFGTVRKQCANLPVELRTFPQEGAAACKAEIVKSLPGSTVCLGNGFNDILMFQAAALSIAIVEKEGMCASLLPYSDVLVNSPLDGLDLLMRTNRLRATLRS